MEKHMYYCRELNTYYATEYFGWFDNDGSAIGFFKEHIKRQHKNSKKQKWSLGRVLPQNDVSSSLVTTTVMMFDTKGGK